MPWHYSEVMEIPLEKLITPAHYTYDEIRELVDDVREHGLKEPILVYDRKDGFYIIANGAHRNSVAMILGWKTISCIIIEMMPYPKPKIGRQAHPRP